MTWDIIVVSVLTVVVFVIGANEILKKEPEKEKEKKEREASIYAVKTIVYGYSLGVGAVYVINLYLSLDLFKNATPIYALIVLLISAIEMLDNWRLKAGKDTELKKLEEKEKLKVTKLEEKEK